MQYKQTRNGCASFRVFCCVYKFRFYLHPYRMHSESKGLFLLRCPIKSSHLTLILDQSSVCGTRQLRYRQCGCLICRPRHLLAPSLFPPLAAVGCATAATRSVRFICHWQRSLCSPRANQVSTGHLVAPVCGLVPLFRQWTRFSAEKPRRLQYALISLVSAYIRTGCIRNLKDSPTS